MRRTILPQEQPVLFPAGRELLGDGMPAQRRTLTALLSEFMAC
jgi:hypothetical protein